MADNDFYKLNLVLDVQDKLTKQLAKADQEVKKAEKHLKETAAAAKELDKAKAEPKIDANSDKALAKLNRIEQLMHKIDRITAQPHIEPRDRTLPKTSRVEHRLRRLTEKTWHVTLALKDRVSGKITSIKNTLTSPAGMLGIGIATAGLGELLADSAQKAMDFSAQLSNIQALTNMSGAELDKVKQKALDLGAKTQFSSTEAVQGMTELLKAGMSVKQVMSGAADAALSLAAAGDLTLPEAAEIMSTAMNSFHIKDAAHAADILAGAANASATDVHDLKYALSAVASVAASVGMSFDDTNTALAVFAQNGLKGSDAGTSLKTMLMRLEPMGDSARNMMVQLHLLRANGSSLFYDEAGHMRSLADIADILRTHLAGLTDEQRQAAMQTMFGADAIRGATILYKEGAKGIEGMYKAMTLFKASDVAQKKWDNAKGAVIRLKSAFENFQIEALSPLEPAIAKTATALGSFFTGNAKGAASAMAAVNNEIVSFIDGLENNADFQKLQWGDKIVYILDRMTDAISTWVNGPGGQQFSHVMTKLAEIGIRAFLAAILGMFKGAFKALLHGNLLGAAGLAMGGVAMGGGALARGVLAGGKALGSLALGKSAATYGDALALAKQSGRGAIGARLDAMRFAVDMSPTGKAIAWASKAAAPMGKALSWAGKIIKPLAVITDVVDFATSSAKAKTAGGIAGHWTGMIAGGKLGAAAGGAIGSMFGGIGAAPGAAIGGVIGSIGGFFAGDKLGEIVGAWIDQAATTAAQHAQQMCANTSQYFSQLVDESGAYLSALPGRVDTWMSQATTTATQYAQDAYTGTVQWFDQLPGHISSAMQTLATAISSACSQIIADIRAWFAQVPGIIAGAFRGAAAAVSSKMHNIGASLQNLGHHLSFGLIPAAANNANGGVITSPTLTWVAEAGYPEVIIPTDPAKRANGMSLWQQAGAMLGVGNIGGQIADLNGVSGAGGPQVALARGGTAAPAPTTSNNFSFSGLRVQVGSNMSEDDMALTIGRRILAEVKQSFQNRG